MDFITQLGTNPLFKLLKNVKILKFPKNILFNFKNFYAKFKDSIVVTNVF